APGAGVSPAEAARRAAVAADESGNYAEAVRLYESIVERFGDTQPRLVEMSRSRARYLRKEHDVPPAPTDAVKPPAKAQSTVPVSVGERRAAGGAARDEPRPAS